MKDGPAIEMLTRRLADTPEDFLEKAQSAVDVPAVIGDLLRDLGAQVVSGAELDGFSRLDARRRGLVLISCWLLHDRWFRERSQFAAAAFSFLRGDELADLANTVEPVLFVSDPDRREELSRLALRALDLRPAGESENQAADRLTTLDSISRQRILRETRAAQERIRKVQEAMRKKAAEEAAASYGRE